MKLALVTHGPIASSVNADTKTFRFYSHGIYDDPKCGKKIIIVVKLRNLTKTSCPYIVTTSTHNQNSFILLMNGSVLDS